MKIGIIGGGASGILAGIELAKKGYDVTILEKLDRLGKKILVTGNGRCNLSNTHCHWKYYNSKAKPFVEAILASYSPAYIESYFEQMGLFCREEDQGRLYPNSGQGSAVLHVLEKQVKALNIKVYLNEAVKSVSMNKGLFKIELQKETIAFHKLVIATGGLVYAKLGCTGIGYDIGKAFGHQIISPKPGLVQLNTKTKGFESLKGIRAKGKASLWVYPDNQWDQGTKLHEEVGEVQFNKDGISGICVMNLSSKYAEFLNKKRLHRGQKVYGAYVSIDFMPQFTQELLKRKIKELLKTRKEKEILDGMVNQRLTDYLLNQYKHEVKVLGKVEALVRVIKEMKVYIDGTRDFSYGQVTVGGIDLKDISVNTLESTQCKNLYFIGEVLDVDGLCGGFNLHWAFASALYVSNQIE